MANPFLDRVAALIDASNLDSGHSCPYVHSGAATPSKLAAQVDAFMALDPATQAGLVDSVIDWGSDPWWSTVGGALNWAYAVMQVG